jgi:hypothetical protein
MKGCLLLITCGLLLQSCQNDPPAEPLTYTYKSLHDTTASYLHPFELHMFADTSADFYFTIGLIHDSLGTNAHCFALPLKTNRILVKGEDEIPPFEKGNQISSTLSTPYYWDRMHHSLAVLTVADPPVIDSTWTGAWAGIGKRYLSVQLHDNSQVYNGWIAISIDTFQRKMIFHEFAWQKIPNKDALAGIH